MSTKKVLIIGIFGILVVMLITAVIHLVAPYVAVLVVIWLVVKMMLEKPTKPGGQ